MDIWQLLLVGIVQGLTEFLPISSSAHLVLLPELLGRADQGLQIDIAAHLGTFVAALVYFRRDWLDVLGMGPAEPSARSESRRLLVRLAVGTAPVLVAGYLMREWVATAARNPWIVAWAFILFGLLLGIADRRGRKTGGLETLTLRGALFAGFAQALALIPGASRSGTTITAGLLLGMTREAATRLSFLLFVPVSAAVGAYEAVQLWQAESSGQIGPMVVVGLASAVVGWICIHGLLGFVRRSSMMPFVIYRLVVGGAILVVLFRQGSDFF